MAGLELTDFASTVLGLQVCTITLGFFLTSCHLFILCVCVIVDTCAQLSGVTSSPCLSPRDRTGVLRISLGVSACTS